MANSTVPSFSIGTSSPSVIRMAGAYATFAASGQQREPFSVTQVKKLGEVMYQHETVTKRAFDNVVADNVTDVLKNVVEHGTGTPAKLPGRDVAGKTGTTDDNLSAWFVGYTPQLSTAISMYRLDDNEKHKGRKFEKMYGTGGEEKIHGASFPAQIWHDYMAEAMQGKKVVDFPKAEPIGDKLYGGGASSPKPTPSYTPPPSPSITPSDTPPPSAPASPPSPPDPTESCGAWDWNCQNNNGGTSDGGDNSGADSRHDRRGRRRHTRYHGGDNGRQRRSRRLQPAHAATEGTATGTATTASSEVRTGSGLRPAGQAGAGQSDSHGEGRRTTGCGGPRRSHSPVRQDVRHAKCRGHERAAGTVRRTAHA